MRKLYSTFVQEYLNHNLNEKNISIDDSRIDGMRRVVCKKRFTKSQIDIRIGIIYRTITNKKITS